VLREDRGQLDVCESRGVGGQTADQSDGKK
jgi:hypothetical protein